MALVATLKNTGLGELCYALGILAGVAISMI
ncbi:1,4-dihydroxy-2-naphthoate octaprenyltransferase [Propionibacterium freudenreichii]|nr:1,4-dihydroxy-2-naphthoate octaprenyltransferase [Propionibacterium freudenreichii]